MWQRETQEKTLAWARYLFWAELSQRNLENYAESSRLQHKWQDWWHFFAHLSQWYASEYVVIEGWREAELHDSIIDESLARWSDVVDLLRRYRNGVFHYQPKLVEPRFMPILEESECSMFLVYHLHSEFLRYYWSYVNDFPGLPEQCAEFREKVLHIVGWIPEDVMEARAAQLRQLAREADEFTAGDVSKSGEELRVLADNCRIVAAEQLKRYRQECRKFLLKTGSS
jgi:hypothetical protein